MMSRKKFKLLDVPQPPDKSLIHEEKRTIHTDSFICGTPIKDFISQLNDYANVHPNARVNLKLNYDGCYYEGDTPSAVFEIYKYVTVDDRYVEEYSKYLVRLEKYKKWYEANRDKIEEELKFRELEKIEDLKKRVRRLEAEATKLKKCIPE